VGGSHRGDELLWERTCARQADEATHPSVTVAPKGAPTRKAQGWIQRADNKRCAAGDVQRIAAGWPAFGCWKALPACAGM